jgi:small GTP-binding protein
VLEDAIGYRFKDASLLDHALTHVSATTGDRSGSYQRLEFLGDHVLGLVISDMLFRAFPKADEGELSRRLADLVRRESCADVARAIDLGTALKLGASEANAGGRVRTAMLADVCEALIGAVFIDGGYAAGAAMIERLWGSACARRCGPCAIPKRCCRNGRRRVACRRRSIVRLAARAASQPRIPRDRRAAQSRADRGLGPSKRAAEQAAAAAMLAREGVGWIAAMVDATAHEAGTRCGFITLIGAPNAGKSTLVNALVGSKVAIVTPKVQTTRALLRGIAMVDKAQLVFIDTPGIFAPRRRLDRAMVTTAWGGARDGDLVAVLIDAKRGIDDEAEAIFGHLAEISLPKVLILNKVDLVEKATLLALTENANSRAKFDATFMVSALKGDGVEDVRIGSRAMCRRDLGTIPRTRCRTRPCASWR